MSTARYLIGDVFDVMATLPDNSVDLVLTSPPFLALRSYLPADHPDKTKEIGSEPTPAEFLDTLLALTAEWGRLLGPYGSIAVELGDTYAGSGGAGGDYNQGGWREGEQPFDGSMKHARIHDPKVGPPIQDKHGKRQGGGAGWPLDKSICFIPQLYGASLAYGRNLLTGEPSPAGQWRVRNLVAWCRPNPPVGALGDKFRPATSYITVACRARDRWFDLDAVRTEHKPHSEKYGDAETRARHANDGYVVPERGDGERMTHGLNPAGAPPLDWWEISTEPYAGSHYATWPRKLLTRPIDAMCPRHVCTQCGQPRRRLVGDAEYVQSRNGGTPAALHFREGERVADGVKSFDTTGKGDNSVTRVAPTLGWSDCGHDSYRSGIVLDPFAGSGTTLAVATGMGRDAIGIDIDSRNADLAAQRVGMFLTVEEPGAAA